MILKQVVFGPCLETRGFGGLVPGPDLTTAGYLHCGEVSHLLLSVEGSRCHEKSKTWGQAVV